jgi:hypothetical protein
VIIAVTQGRHDTRHERGEPRLALDQRPRADIVAVEMQKIELLKFQIAKLRRMQFGRSSERLCP